MALWCQLLGVDGLARTVTIISGAVPTSAAAYIQARQLGGDAPLMAAIITLQVLFAAFTLPVIIAVL